MIGQINGFFNDLPILGLMVGRQEVELVETALLKGGAALKPASTAQRLPSC
jgi:hypothetical protein